MNRVVGASTRWIYGTDTTNTSYPDWLIYTSFGTPVEQPATGTPNYCGKVVMTDLHVYSGSGKKAFPSGCDLSKTSTAQEKPSNSCSSISRPACRWMRPHPCPRHPRRERQRRPCPVRRPPHLQLRRRRHRPPRPPQLHRHHRLRPRRQHHRHRRHRRRHRLHRSSIRRIPSCAVYPCCGHCASLRSS
jgi:hypothetical protein